MSSTFGGLEIAKRSLFAQQAALLTTGHNISNANTQGYSRQTVSMTESIPIEYPGLSKSTVPGQMGQGVEIGQVNRIRDSFLDDQFRNQNKLLGQWTVQQDTLDKLQQMVNEPSNTGIRTVLDNFWNSWSDLSKNPESIDGKKVVRENAQALVDVFNSTSKQIDDLKNDITNNMNAATAQINSYTSSIAQLNDQITKIESLGDNANDLRDQRDLLTDQLSNLVNVTVQNTSTGYNVSIGSTNLVSGSAATATTADALVGAFGKDLTSGQVYGMIKSRDQYAAGYQQQLDTLANTIANGPITVTIPAGSILPEGATAIVNGVSTTFTGSSRVIQNDTQVTVNGVNGLHQLGYLASDPATSGGLFFTGDTAGTFQLNPAIANDASQIATSMSLSGTDPSSTVIKGNNSLALIMGELKNTTFSFPPAVSGGQNQNATVDDYYGSIVGGLGVQAQEAQRNVTNQQALTDQVDSNRQSVSGVSLDEEMSNMIKYQHAYNAAARVMTTFDETLDKIINSMGLVGR